MEQTYCKHEVLLLVFSFLIRTVNITLVLTDFFPFSLGCKAIFLLGGKSREDEPLAMFLRSGDIVLMAGEARECFHGQYNLCYFLFLVY